MTTSESRIIENNLFFNEVAERLNAGERVRIRAKGNSMLPFIRNSKDMIILSKPDIHSLQKGRLLLVHLADGRYVLHRVKKTEENSILLQGDGNLSIFERCSPRDVIAEVVCVIRNGKAIEQGSFRWNLYRCLWPGNYLMRRIFLALYRRIPILQI